MGLYNRFTGFQKKRPSGGGVYTTTATDFDASTPDYYSVSGMTGAADAKSMTGSFWINIDALPASVAYIYEQESGGIDNTIRLFSDGDIWLQFENGSGVSRFRANTTSTNILTAAAGWQHVCFSFDLDGDDDSNYHLYVDGSSKTTTPSTFTDDTIDFTSGIFAIMSNGSAANSIDGCMTEFWMEFGRFTDFSVASNVEKFRDTDGKPVDLGSDGSTPFGAAPDIYLKGGEADFGTNLGSGSNFTQNGSPTDCGSSPSD